MEQGEVIEGGQRAMRTIQLLFSSACLAVAALSPCLQLGAAADSSWPESAWRSDNGRFVVTVSILTDTLALYEKRGDDFVRLWSVAYSGVGEKYELSGAVCITDDGRCVVVRAAWHDLWAGGNAIVFLGAEGEVLSSYRLKQILTKREIFESGVSPMSLWWKGDGLFFFRRGQTQFACVTQRGTVRVFSLATGQPVSLSPGLHAAVRHEAVVLARQSLASGDYDQQTTGAIMVGVLGDVTSVPVLKQLLEDWRAKGIVFTIRSSGMYEGYPFYGVQAAAGEALAMLLGPDAAPLLERKLAGANPQMAAHWKRLLRKTAGAELTNGAARP